jgi:hypothetical protein
MRHFSDRHGYSSDAAEITVREDAPDDLRYAVAQIAKSAGFTPKAIRNIVCQVLFVAPDRNNWSEYPNIWDESLTLLRNCEWFKVYDIAEAFWRSLEHDYESQQHFQDELNRCFREKGIGWELKDPVGIVFRGGATFVTTTKQAGETLRSTGRTTAAAEINEALKDLSRRPEPDRTGAVQHAMSALECTARDILGASGTLGKLVSQLNLPRPLDAAVEKLWGFASDRARHLREGEAVTDDEAELVVTVACAICDFLAKRT